MRILSRLSPLVFLLLAIGLYAIGLSTGATIVFLLGFLAELGFWVGLFKIRGARS